MSEEDRPEDNTADPAKVEEQDKFEKLQSVQHLEDVRKIVSTEAGKRVFWLYMDHCNVFQEIRGEIKDVYFEEGQRSIGLIMMRNLVQAAPAVLTELMTKGAIEDEERRVAAEEHRAEQEKKRLEEDGGLTSEISQE